MKPIKRAALATWLLEHLTFGLKNEALCGDLLEELQHGRSAAWYWRQVCCAIATGALSRMRDWLFPLVFCAGWSSLYHGWNLLSKTVLGHAMPDGRTGLAWPWSAFSPLGYGMVPAVTFVWFGFLLYLLLRPGLFHEVEAHRLLWGLSASLNVLLVSTVVLLRYFRHSRIDLDAVTRADFYSAFHLWSISIPIALSLLAALFFTSTHTPRLMRRRRLPPMHFIGKVLRAGQFSCVVLIVLGTSGALSMIYAQQGAGSSQSAVQFVTVDTDVRLEVLDWGGTGHRKHGKRDQT